MKPSPGLKHESIIQSHHIFSLLSGASSVCGGMLRKATLKAELRNQTFHFLLQLPPCEHVTLSVCSGREPVA